MPPLSCFSISHSIDSAGMLNLPTMEERSSSILERRWLRGLLLAIPFVLAIEMVDRVFSYTVGADHARYVLLARSIAEGHGYTDFFVSGSLAPVDYPPPLFPLLLSMVYTMAGYNFMWMHLVVASFYVAAFFIIRRYFGTIVNGGTLLPLLLAFLFATNPIIIHYSKEILPEIPFIFLMFLSLYLAERYSARRELLPYGLYLPAIVLLAIFMKNHGMVLYVAIGVTIFLRFLKEREGLYLKQLLLFGVITMVPVIVWMGRDVLMGGLAGGPSFTKSLVEVYNPAGSGFFSRVAENTLDMAYFIPESVLYSSIMMKGLPQPVWHILLGIVLIVFSTGFLYCLINKMRPVELALLLYLVIIVAWPAYGVDMRRYNVVCIPFIYYYLMVGITIVKERFSLKRGANMVLLPLLVLLALNVYEKRGMLIPPWSVEKLYRSTGVFYEDSFRYFEHAGLDTVTNPIFRRYFPCYHNYLQAAYYLREMAPEKTKIMTRRPEVVALLSERWAVRFPYTKDGNRMASYIKHTDTDYILTDSCYPETRAFLVPFISKARDLLEYRGGYRDSEVFEVKRELLQGTI